MCISILCLLLSGCTTQDFEYAGKNKSVYRVEIKNIGTADINYSYEVSLYYIDGKDSTNHADSLTISPSESEKMLLESKEGTYGISANIFMFNHASEIRLKVEKGTGTSSNFVLDRVIDTKISTYDVSVRDGEVY